MKKKTTESVNSSPNGVSRRQVLKTMALAGGTMALGGLPGLSLASTAKHGGILRLGVVRGLQTINPPNGCTTT